MRECKDKKGDNDGNRMSVLLCRNFKRIGDLLCGGAY